MQPANLPGLVIDRSHPIARGLVAWYPLNELGGTRVRDVVSQNWADYTESGGMWGGSQGSGLYFNGNGFFQGNTIAHLPLGASPGSISCWCRSTSTAGSWAWAAGYGSPAGSKMRMIGRNGTTLYGAFYANDFSVSNFWYVGKVSFIALTYDGTNAYFYADGKLLASGAKTLDTGGGSPALFRVGNMTSGPEYWTGDVAHVRIHNRALSLADVQILASDPLAGAYVARSALRYIAPAFLAAWAANSNRAGGSTI